MVISPSSIPPKVDNKLLWDNITPLGFPVVPEVYEIVVIVSPSTLGREFKLLLPASLT